MPVLDRNALVRRPDVAAALSRIDGTTGVTRQNGMLDLQQKLAAELGAPVDAREIRQLVTAWQAQRKDTVDQAVGATIRAPDQRRDWGASVRNARNAFALRTGEHEGLAAKAAQVDAAASAEPAQTDGSRRTRRVRIADWMLRADHGKKGAALALAGAAAAVAMIVPGGGGGMQQSVDGTALPRAPAATRTVDVQAGMSSIAQDAQQIRANAHKQIAHDIVDRATKNLLGRHVKADDPLLAKAERMLNRGDQTREVVDAVKAQIKKSDEFRATKAPQFVQRLHEDIFGRPGPSKGPIVERARAMMMHGKSDAQVKKEVVQRLLDVQVPKTREAPFGLVDLSTERGKDVFRAAAHITGLPRGWAESDGLRALVEHESGGRVGRPNYTYGARAENPSQWASVLREVRAGRITAESTATGLGQLLGYNAENYYPKGLKGVGDPVQEAAGMLRYIASRYDNPKVAWGNHSANPNRHSGVPVIYTAEGY